MLDFHIIISIISIFGARKWGDWRNWKLYYPTILYMIIGDLTYISLSSNQPLWEYDSPIISNDFAELLIAFVVFPCTCLIFFKLYSEVNSSKRLMVYILFFLFCAFVYTSIEGLSFCLGFISYHNGWNLYWSLVFNCIMFPLLLLHYKKPLLVWLPSIILALLVMHRFNLPFSIMK
jgi:hypothetical protein